MSRVAISTGRAAWLALLLFTASCGGEPRRSSARADSAVVGSAPSARAPGNYVGLEYEVLPPRVSAMGGAVLPQMNSGAGGDFGFSYVRTPQGDMIWLESIDKATHGRRPRRMVRAQLRIPPLASDERLFMASCDVGRTLDGWVVAIAIHAPNTTRFTRVRQAWRADPVAQRFDVIPIDGITCEEPGS